jgi:transcriptional regulator with XRE-family HTH domain
VAKSKYESHVLPYFEEIKAWRQEGLSEKDIMKNLGVSHEAWFKYKKRYSEFNDLLLHTKQKLVNTLKRSLWKEAMGFEYTEEETLIEESYLGTKKRIKKVKKYARSAPNLLIFALCNLCPDMFKRMDKEVIDKIDEKFTVQFSDDRIKHVFNQLYNNQTEKDEE